jgi:hypothetical protein
MSSWHPARAAAAAEEAPLKVASATGRSVVRRARPKPPGGGSQGPLRRGELPCQWAALMTGRHVWTLDNPRSLARP